MAKKVLIADDSSANLYLLEAMLKAYGFEVISAQNGREALDKARLNPPDLIVTDILMPVMDGYTLCRQWKSDDKLKHIPLVFYTATYTEAKDEAFALSLGADRFILKPKEPDIFMNIIKEVLEEKYKARQVLAKPLGEEMEFFRQYNEILFTKLEKKMSDLEIVNQNLRVLEENYRQIFENAMDVIYTIGTDLNITSMSPSVERVLGYKPQDFIGRPVFNLENILGPESFGQAVDDMILVLKGQTIAARVLRFIARDGTSRYGEVSGSPIMHEGRIISLISVARDITERKEAQDALRESERKYRDLYHYAQVGLFETSLEEAKIIACNQCYCDLAGIPNVESAMGMDVLQLYANPADREEVKKILRTKGYTTNHLLQLRNLSTGKIFWVEFSASVNPSRNIIEGSLIDVTERKLAHEALRESEQKYREMFDFLPIPVYEMDFEANITSANRAIYETIGATEDDLKKGYKAWQLLSPEDIDKSRKNIERLLKGDKIKGTEYTIRRFDGSTFPAIVISSVIYSNEKPVGLRGAIVDITERKQSEAALKQSEERYNALFDRSLDLVYVHDFEGNFIDANAAALRLLGYNREDIPQINFASLMDFGQVSKALQLIDELKRTGSQVEFSEFRLKCKDGRYIDMETKSSVILRDDKQYAVLGIGRDITQRKRAEDNLRLSEEKYRLLLDHAAEAIFVVQEGKLKFVNPATILISGYPEKDLVSRPFTEFIHPEDSAKVLDHYKKRVSGEEVPTSYVFRIMTRDGFVKWVEIHVALIFWEGKAATLNFMIDITERKRADEALRQSNARFRSYFELPLVGIAITSPEKGWIEANDRLLDILGYSWRELQGMTWAELTHPEDLDADVEQFNRVLANEIDSYMIDKRFIRKDGEVIWTNLAVGCVRKSDGTVDYFVALFEDITERKQSEEELHESEKRYRLLADNSTDVIWKMTLEGKFIYVSPSITNLSGYTPQETMEIPFYKYVEESYVKPVMAEITSQLTKPPSERLKSFRMELQQYCKDGTIKDIEVTVGWLFDDRGDPIGIQGSTRDITSRKRAEEELQLTLKSLRNSFGATVQVMVAAVESRDPYTAGHQLRAANLACAIAGEMGLPQDKIEGLQMAGAIHDIGKLSIPSEILTKPTRLTDIEFSLIKEHPRIGYEMLKDVESPWPLAQIVYQHHERMDGSGYPRNLKGDEILLEARIMAVADVVEAMGSHRPYRATLGIEAALEEIKNNKGTLYDNAVVDACLKLFREKGYQL
jgi:PAS domain S-box-containing protein